MLCAPIVHVAWLLQLGSPHPTSSAVERCRFQSNAQLLATPSMLCCALAPFSLAAMTTMSAPRQGRQTCDAKWLDRRAGSRVHGAGGQQLPRGQHVGAGLAGCAGCAASQHTRARNARRKEVAQVSCSAQSPVTLLSSRAVPVRAFQCGACMPCTVLRSWGAWVSGYTRYVCL